jgi:serine/threonine-protein kinase
MIMQPDPWLETIVGEDGRYCLKTPLGKGGMSKVYKALDLHESTPSRPVYRAIKFLSVNLLDDLSSKLRFQREMKACLALTDPLIVRTLDFGVASLKSGRNRQEFPMIVMELIEGKTLHDLLRPRLSIPRSIHIAKQLAKALQAVHYGVVWEGKRIQFIHRDLKPANIFVIQEKDGSESIKLGDFGLVKWLGDLTEKSITHTGTYAGTPEYSAPEQIHQFKMVDNRADLYSFGCILYRMLSGTNPFGLADNASLVQWFTAHTEQSPRSLDPDLKVPGNLEAIIFRCLQKDPNLRFSSAAELSEALIRVESQVQSIVDPLETRLTQILWQEQERYQIEIRMKRKGKHLALLLSRSSLAPLDYSSLLEALKAKIADVAGDALTTLTLFSSPPGQVQPDWQTSIPLDISATAVTRIEGVNKDKDPNTSTPTQKREEETGSEDQSFDTAPPLDLKTYCFVRNPLMLSTSLPDPVPVVARAVKGFHDFSNAKKTSVLPLLRQWFLDPRPKIQAQAEEKIALLQQPVPEWFQALKTLKDLEKGSVAIWLSRYCIDPEKVLPRITASLLVEEEARKATVAAASVKPTQIPVLADKVLSYARPHPIILCYPFGPLLGHWTIALLLWGLLPPERLVQLVLAMLNPLIFIVMVLLLLALARFASGILKFINIAQVLREHPHSVGTSLLIGFVSLLYAVRIPLPIEMILVGGISLASFGLHLRQKLLAFRSPLLAVTELARLIPTNRELSLSDLKNKELDSYTPDQVQDLRITLGILEKVLHCGTIELFLQGKPRQIFKNVAHPFRFKNLYDKQVAQTKQRYEVLQGAQHLTSEDPWLAKPIGEGGRYRLDHLIGKGGMGKVYKGMDQQLHLPVAIKCMQEGLDYSPERLEQFQAEIQASIYLDNERVVRVLNFGAVSDPETESAPFPFLVMEYIPSPTLAQAMQEQPRWPSARVLHLAEEISLALDAIHKGVMVQGRRVTFVHRDLKPANIFLVKGKNGQESVKIADFGLVMMQHHKQPDPSGSGKFVGSVRYASPEQCQGNRRVDSRADLYSLGCILYELLSGSNPFGLPPQASTSQFMLAHLQKTPLPFPEQLRVPPKLAEVVLRCLKKSPDERYATATELRSSLLLARLSV